MDRIVTLTVNPCVDMSAQVDKVVPTEKLRCSTISRDPGGGGINVARVVHELGGEALAIYTSGGPSGRLLQRLVDRPGLSSQTIAIAEETRTDFTVRETSSGDQYRFVLPGPELSAAEWQECLDVLTVLTPAPSLVVASGSLPPGVPDDFYGRVAAITHGLGAKLFLDTSGPALAAAIDEPIYLIKPNLRELSQVVGHRLDSRPQRIAAARELMQRGNIELVALTLAAEGGLLISHDRVWSAAVPKIEVNSAVGAGDSFLGGFVTQIGRNGDLAEAFRHGMAAGAAALLTPGTELCRKADVDRLLAAVEVTELPGNN